MARKSLMSLALVFSVLITTSYFSAGPVRADEPEPPRNLLGTTDELQLVTELLFSLTRDYGAEPILVVLSVDNTLLETSEQPGQCGFDGTPQAVQPDTAEQVQRMQEQGLRVIAISEQGSECQGSVLEALSLNDITFSSSSVQVNSSEAPEHVESGVIFTGGKDKGQALKKILASTGDPQPALIVMVDYRQKDLNSVMAAFSFSKVKVHAWRYTRLETRNSQLRAAQS